MDQKQKKASSSASKGGGGGRGVIIDGRSLKKKRDASSTGGRPLTRSIAAKKPRVDTEQPQQQQQRELATKLSTVAAITPTSAYRPPTSKQPTTFGAKTAFSSNRESAVEGALLLQSSSSSSLLPPAPITLPPMIPNVFAGPSSSSTPTHDYTANNCNFTPCQCLGHQCSRGCISAEYYASYGWEQKTLLKAKEDMEYEITSTPSGDADTDIDPLEPLVSSGMVPPQRNRTRKQSDWFGPRSIQWDLDDYMDRQTDLAPKMRSILIDWIVELTEEYNLSPTTFHLAVTLVDKSLASVPTSSDDDDEDDDETCRRRNQQHNHNHDNDNMEFYVSRDMLQCLGCACTWIAAKMEEVKAPSVDDFVYISDNIYRREQILEMEFDVCSVLKFRLQHVTPVHYAHEFLLASEARTKVVAVGGGYKDDDGPKNTMMMVPVIPTGPAFHPILRHMVYYLLELSRIAYEFVPTKPSLVAASAIFLARATLGIRDATITAMEIEMDPATTTGGGYWTETLEYYSGYSVKDMKDTVRILLQYHQKAEESKLNAVFTKYSKAKFMRVSTKTVLRHEELPF